MELINKYDGIFVENVDDLINKINLFGYYFASIDVRQNRKEIRRSLKFVETNNKSPSYIITGELF